MKRVSTAALALAIAAGSMTAAPADAQRNRRQQQQPEAQTPEFKLGKEFRVPAAAAQAALAADDLATAQTQIDATLAVASQPDERYVANQLLLQLAEKRNDDALRLRAIDGVIESGRAPADQTGRLRFAAGQLAYNAKDFGRALQHFQAAQVAGYDSANLHLLSAEANFKQNNLDAGLAGIERAIDIEKAAGRKPTEDWYRRAITVSNQAKQPAKTSAWLQRLVREYPTATNWRTALLVYRDTARLEWQENLDLLRLMRATKSLTGEQDYREYAAIAFEHGLPGEAVSVVDEARTGGVPASPSSSLGQLQASASAKVKADRASLPAAPSSSSTGRSLSATGDAYLAYRDYAKAADFYRAALAKGSVDNDLVNTRIGIALAMQNQNDAARQAFAQVGGQREQLADFWELYLDQRA